MHCAIVDFVIDIVQNSCEADSGLVELEVVDGAGNIAFEIRDDGKGMSPGTLARALDPFHTEAGKHPGRKVGLGLPFLKQAVELSGGDFSIRSEVGKGTSVSFRFDMTNVDCPPLGDFAGMLMTILCMPGPAEMRISRRRGNESYELCKSELAGALGSLEDVSSLVLLKQYLASLEEEYAGNSAGQGFMPRMEPAAELG